MMTPEEFQQFMAEQAPTRGPDISQEEVDQKRLAANLMDAGGEAAAIMTGREYKPSSNPLAGRLEEMLGQRKAQQAEDEKRQFLLAQLQSRQVMDPQAKFNLEQAQLMAPDVQAKSRADAELAGKRVEGYGQPSEQEKYMMQKFGLDKQKYEDTAQNRDLERQLLEKKLAGDNDGSVSEREKFEYQKEKDRLKTKPDKAEKSITASQSAALGFGKRLEQAEGVFDALEKADYDRSDISSSLGSLLPTSMQSSEAQQQEQAERNFINAVLREESGAVIGPTEFASAEKQYFPRAGDSADVIKQKKANRQQKLATFKNEAGPHWDKIPVIRPEEAPKELSSQYKKALKWAESNPDDPRAIKIKERIGVQ